MSRPLELEIQSSEGVEVLQHFYDTRGRAGKDHPLRRLKFGQSCSPSSIKRLPFQPEWRACHASLVDIVLDIDLETHSWARPASLRVKERAYWGLMSKQLRAQDVRLLDGYDLPFPDFD